MPTTACDPKAYTKTRFFVEGEMERDAFRAVFGIRAKRIGINGNAVSMDAIARNISADLIRDRSVSDVFIMFDREGRSDTSEELSGQLTGLMLRRFPNITFKIVIPDRDTESWIFSDFDIVAKYFNKPIGGKSKFEGRKGSDEIKKYIGSGRYEKILDGVRLFGRVRWSVIAERSASARGAGLVAQFPDCAWLRR